MSDVEDGRYHLAKRTNGYYYWKRPYEKTFHSTKCKNIRDARAYINKVMSEGIQSNKALQDYAKDFYVWGTCSWIERQQAKGKAMSEKWAQSRRAHLEHYIFPKWGLRKLHQFNPVEYEKWLIGLPLANGTKNAITYSLNIVLKEAKREGLIRFNPIAETEPLANNYKKRDAFSQDELRYLFPGNEEALLTVWGNRYYATLFTLMVTSGMRVGEVIALQWNHVLWAQSAIMIKQAVKNDNSIGTTKSNEQRGVIVPQVTLDLLTMWRSETLCPEDEDFIFHGLSKQDFNKPVHRRTVLKKFKDGLERAEIEQTDRNLVVHSLRHTYNTIMRSIIPQEQLRYMMGHKTEAMTNRYDQSTPESRIQGFISEKGRIDGIWKDI